MRRSQQGEKEEEGPVWPFVNLLQKNDSGQKGGEKKRKGRGVQEASPLRCLLAACPKKKKKGGGGKKTPALTGGLISSGKMGGGASLVIWGFSSKESTGGGRLCFKSLFSFSITNQKNSSTLPHGKGRGGGKKGEGSHLITNTPRGRNAPCP